jgi:hypothetical protein
MAAWITPCSSSRVHATGSSIRRQIIGLMPTSRIFTCRIGPVGAVNAGRVPRVMADLEC